jgi:hypothetical protein
MSVRPKTCADSGGSEVHKSTYIDALIVSANAGNKVAIEALLEIGLAHARPSSSFVQPDHGLVAFCNDSENSCNKVSN